MNEPIKSSTFRGADEVGGRDDGGRAMFCILQVRSNHLDGVLNMLTSSNLAFPPLVTRTGWIPSSPDVSS